jgi:hypothetical protein
MSKAELFVELQRRANLELDHYGEISDHTIEELTRVADTLTDSEIDEALILWNN